MNDAESIKNLYKIALMAGVIIAIFGIFIGAWYRLKVRQAILKDTRTMLRPKRWMWVVGMAGILLCVLYFTIWYVAFKNIDRI